MKDDIMKSEALDYDFHSQMKIYFGTEEKKKIVRNYLRICKGVTEMTENENEYLKKRKEKKIKLN